MPDRICPPSLKPRELASIDRVASQGIRPSGTEGDIETRERWPRAMTVGSTHAAGAFNAALHSFHSSTPSAVPITIWSGIACRGSAGPKRAKPVMGIFSGLPVPELQQWLA